MESKDLDETTTGFNLKKIFFVIAFIYIALLSWFIINDYNQTIQKVKTDGIKNSIIASLQVRSTFEQIRNILIIISSELSENNLSHLKTDGLSRYLYSRNMLISDIEYLLLTDNQGKVIASSSEIPAGINLGNVNYFNKIKKSDLNHMIYPEQKKSLISNEWYIPFIHKIHDSHNKFAGILEASVPLNLWYQYFQHQMILPLDEISIINLSDCAVLGTSTKVINHFESKYITKKFCLNPNIKTAKDAGASYVDSNNNIISYSFLPEFKIAIVFVSSPIDFLAPFYQKTSLALAISFIILLGFWWLIKSQLSTEEKLREERIQNINSSKMASLGEMAGGIAHEINTPLAIINMKVEQLFESVEEKDYTDEELKKALLLIKKTTDRIAKIINGLRFFARDGSVLNMEKNDIEKIIEETFSFCSEKMRVNDVKLEVLKNYGSNKLYLNCRAVEISQVILNLLNNSYDAISSQEEKWIKLHINDLGTEVEISVEDSGAGISKNLQKKIMQPFFTTKEIGKGTGLGLSISRGIIDSHQGKFFINNDSKNTKFTIILSKYLET